MNSQYNSEPDYMIICTTAAVSLVAAGIVLFLFRAKGSDSWRLLQIGSLALLPIIAPFAFTTGLALKSCQHTREGPLGIICVFGILALSLGLAIDVAILLPIIVFIVKRRNAGTRFQRVKHMLPLFIAVCLISSSIGFLEAPHEDTCTIAV